MFPTPGRFDSEEPRAARLKATGRALLAFVLLPNLLFLLIGMFLFTNRAPVNVDYAVLGSAWLWLPVWLRIAGFATLFVLDAICSTAAMYNISPLAGVVALTRSPPALVATVIAGVVVAAAFAAGVGRFAVRFLRDRRRRHLIMCILLIVVAATSFAGVAGSGTMEFARELRDRIRSASADAYPVVAASDELRAAAQHNELTAENIVVVMMESMGVLRDSVLRAFVWAPLDAPAITHRYNARRGDIAFRGGTTSGELRELCGVFADYITLPRNVLPSCLPRLLARNGFETIALHGYQPSFYDRDRWYRALFKHVYFADDLADQAGERRCGTQFRGICDRDVFRALEPLLLGGQRRFIYWMTLDAHTPVDLARLPEFAGTWAAHGLSAREPCRDTPQVCLQALFWHDVLVRLAALAMNPKLAQTRFLIVGDHAPAFVRRDRAMGFIPGRVPYLELTPRP